MIYLPFLSFSKDFNDNPCVILAFFRMDVHSVKQWLIVTDHLMTHDKTSFKELLSEFSWFSYFNNRVKLTNFTYVSDHKISIFVFRIDFLLGQRVLQSDDV